MLDDAPILQPKDVHDRRARILHIETTEHVEHHEVSFGNDAFDLKLEFRMRARKPHNKSDESFRSIGDLWIVLAVIGADKFFDCLRRPPFIKGHMVEAHNIVLVPDSIRIHANTTSLTFKVRVH